MHILPWTAGLLQAVYFMISFPISSTSPSPKIADFKLNLHRYLEGTRIRKRRQLSDDGSPSPGYQMRVGSSAPEELPYLSDYKLTFWIPIVHQLQRQVLMGTEEGHLILFELSPENDRQGNIVAYSDKEHVSSKAKAFSYFDEQWFTVLQSSGNQTWIQLYQRVGRGLEQRQTINLDGASDFDLVSLKGVQYMAVVTAHRTFQRGTLKLYLWTRTQFDVIARRTVYAARSVACWILDGSLYMAVAQEFHEEGHFEIGSPVYLYNAKEANVLILVQTLKTYGPKKVLHFYVSGSHYVIFIGAGDVEIYWWTSAQFLLWQRLDGTAHASDASILTLDNGEVVIVIALGEEAFFFILDEYGYYKESFTMVAGYKLTSLQFMYSGRAYYALALFASAHQNARPIWKLTLKPHEIPAKSSSDRLTRCLGEVSKALNSRQVEIDSIQADLNRVWLKDKEQFISSELIVTGSTTSFYTSAIKHIIVVQSLHKCKPESTSVVSEGIFRLRSLVHNIQSDISKSLLKSSSQVISGTKYFQDTVYIPSLRMQSTNVDIPINGIPVSRVAYHTLKKHGNQSFTSSAFLGNIHAESVQVGEIGGIKIDDFLLLHGNQEVTGEIQFLNCGLGNLWTESVNSFLVHSFVTTNSEQEISHSKNILNLKSLIVGASGQLNGENLNELAKEILTVDGDEVSKSRHLIISDVVVNGDLFLTGSINGKVDLSHLIHGSVSRNTNQTLEGPYIFKSGVNVHNNININGSLNDVNLHQLLTRTTDQVIHGDITFDELNFSQDLNVEYVNGYNLYNTAVRKHPLDPVQFVHGLKVFTNSIAADFIEMTEYVKLDGVDPSHLVEDIVKHKEGVVKNNHTVFHSAVVLGNLTVIEGINGYDVFDLPENYWMKSKDQAIEVPVNIQKISAYEDVVVTHVNTLHLDNDLVHSYQDEVIISVKSFSDALTLVDQVDVSSGATINGFDVISYKTEINEYVEEGTVLGRKTLGDLEIFGDVEASSFNGFEILENLMRPNAFQIVQGEITFPSELTVIPGNLDTVNLDFNTYNGINLHQYIDNTVSKTSPKSFKNKVFTTLRANSLSLSDGSSLSGISLTDFMNRVVTIDTPQQIPSGKHFFGALNFRNSMTTENLNRENLTAFLNNVVVTDQTDLITAPKIFLGSVVADNFFVQSLLNGIDFNRMCRDAFMKSTKNTVLSHMVFTDGLEVGSLKTSSLNGIPWNELILLNEENYLGPTWLMSDTKVHANLFSTGLINGCNLFEVAERALYTNNTPQTIKEEVTIQKVEIIGNLYLRNNINMISVEDLQRKFITVSGDQIITSDVHLGSGMSLESLNLMNVVNGVDVPFVISDSVKHSESQVITGQKSFLDINADSISTRELSLAGKLDGVDIEDLFNNAVLKSGHQVIDGDKLFNNFSVGVANIQGYINGIRLPQDIVQTSTSEHIQSPVYFMSDLTIGTDLLVHQNIDDVDIQQLLSERVTLSGFQEIFSNLTFLHDVAVLGNLNVDGTINDVLLDLVYKTRHPFPIEGRKVFIQDLIVDDIDARSVNGHDIRDLKQKILKYNADNSVNELQIFQSPLSTQSLFISEWVNNISISQISTVFLNTKQKFGSAIYHFEKMSYQFQNQLSNQIEASSGRILKSAYFILVQEISRNSISRILHSYHNRHIHGGYASMLIWGSERGCFFAEKCCDVEFSYWMRIEESGLLRQDGDAFQGRFYPIQNPNAATRRLEFFMWTNATISQPKWCSVEGEAGILLASFTDDRKFEIFRNIKNAPILSDVKSFHQEHLYIIAGYFYDIKEQTPGNAVIYRYNELAREWTEYRILPAIGVLSLDLTYYVRDGITELLLACGTGFGSYSTIYKWNDAEKEFEVIQNVPSQHVVSTLWLKVDSKQFLAMANVANVPGREGLCLESNSADEILIYSYDGIIRWIQSIPLQGVVSLISVSVEDDTFLIAASNELQSIFIYEWRGYCRFVETQTIVVGEAQHLNTYWAGDDLYLTVSVKSGPSKVLKLVLQGKHKETANENDSQNDDGCISK